MKRGSTKKTSITPENAPQLPTICSCAICREVKNESFVDNELNNWKLKMWRRHNGIK